MESLAILVPIALVLAAAIITAFVWAVRADQFEDLDRHGKDIIFDEDKQEGDRR